MIIDHVHERHDGVLIVIGTQQISGIEKAVIRLVSATEADYEALRAQVSQPE